MFKNRLIGIMVGVLGSLLVFRQVLFVRPGSFLWADSFDPKLMYWIVNWGYHVLFELRQPWNFWNANAFFPDSNTLAFSDSILSLQLFFAPLKALGVEPLSAIYLSLAAFAVAGCFFTERALRKIGTFSNLEIAVIVFATHFSLSLTGYLYHYQLFGFHLAPGFVLYLYLYLRDPQKKYLLILCGLFCFGTAFATYLGPMLLVLSIFLGLPILILRLIQTGLAKYASKIGWSSLAIVLFFAAALYFIQIKPYLAISKDLSPADLKSYVDYSASLSAIFNGFSIFSYWYSPKHFLIYGQWESSYFPGFALLSFGFLFILLIGAGQISRLFPKFRQAGFFQFDQALEEKTFTAYMLGFLVLIWFLSLGPLIKDLNIPSYPYSFLSRHLLGVANIRAPGRFGAWIGLPLSIFSIYFLRGWKVRASARPWILGAFFIVLAIESLPTYPVYPFSVDPQGIYEKVAGYIHPGEIVLELPVSGKDYFDTIRIAQNQLVGSTIGWPRIIVGYGTIRTTTYNRLLYLDGIIQNGGDVVNMTDFTKANNVADILVYLPAYSDALIAQWRDFSKGPSVCKLFETKGYLFLRLDRNDCPSPQ